MRLPRSLTFSIAIIAAIGSATAVRRAIVTKPQPAVIARTPTMELLVAGRAISAGERIQASDLRWQSWPEEAAPEGAIIRNRGRSLNGFDKTYARYPIMAGEPVAEARLVMPGKGSQVAALIATGKRAVAVPVREESAVGGLIQPNDRVDVLWSSNSERNALRQPRAQTLLRGIKVLAVGRSINADAAQTGNRTATLELTPEQARILAGARIGGETSLSLIPFTDEVSTAALPAPLVTDTRPQPVRVLRFGHSTTGYPGRSPQ